MNLKSIFERAVDRSIDGVIKADDEKALRTEFEEYVLTNEVAQGLERFLDSYNNYEGANGVWVSGFFGSGKSHLLKILAFLLENKEIDSERAADIFLPKCRDNEILKGDLQRALAIPSKSLLFNIDQKADVISKTELDALVAVFVKVFDEACGYYGKQGYIAQFERDLDGRGQYQAFMSAYESISGYSWHDGREQSLLESGNIATAYARVSGADEQLAAGILDKYREQYKVSIEDFAAQVKSYIDKQSPGFRLNFFVDEVGQYIADNIKLMTNLQTIAESLATKCKGRAWILVTAQEDMGAVVGEMTKQHANDFSKIQARFATRMKLTSKDVDEVIQKRLLLKNETGVATLTEVYHKQHNNFRTLLDFGDGSKSYNNFQDREHFIHSYPFIPYQFALFQAAIENLSSQGAFEGKYSSVGERSMLGVFQEVVVRISDRSVGQLATFNLMFEGLRTSLKSQIQRAVLIAEQHLGDEFAVSVLKTLFLVKYVKEFKATARNICVLMLSRFDEDLVAFRRKVDEALGLLERQTYIQRNGEVFEYLTDEEKDVEQEIKNTDVDESDILESLEKMIFDEIIKLRKVRYNSASSSSGGHDYSFTRKLDDKLFGREYELAINIFTPFYDKNEVEDAINRRGTGTTELRVLLPADERLIRDLGMYKKTDKYVRQNSSLSQLDSIRRILHDKQTQNQARRLGILSRVQELLSVAKLYVDGSQLEVGSTEPQARIFRGFTDLVTRTYPNLRMLRGVNYSEEQIAGYLDRSSANLLNQDAIALNEAEQEIFSFVQGQSSGQRVTLKTTLERFEKRPYGWPYAAILCVVAQLCSRGKIELRIDSNIVADENIERALRNTQVHPNLVLEAQFAYTQAQVRALKDFYGDFFDTPIHDTDAKSLGTETLRAFAKMYEELRRFQAQVDKYPFLESLLPIIADLKDIESKGYAWCIKDLPGVAEKLLDAKEQIVDPVRKLFTGAQKEIYDKARNFAAEHRANFDYLDPAYTAELQGVLRDPECFRGQKMQRLKDVFEKLQVQVADVIQKQIAETTESIRVRQNLIANSAQFETISDDLRERVLREFDLTVDSIKSETVVPVIKDRLRKFESERYGQLLAMLEDTREKGDGAVDVVPLQGALLRDGGVSPNIAAPGSTYVALRDVKLDFNQPWLSNEDEVARYIDELQRAMVAMVRAGKRIHL